VKADHVALSPAGCESDVVRGVDQEVLGDFHGARWGRRLELGEHLVVERKDWGYARRRVGSCRRGGTAPSFRPSSGRTPRRSGKLQKPRLSTITSTPTVKSDKTSRRPSSESPKAFTTLATLSEADPSARATSPRDPTSC
jgi:hypothetical protein